MATQDVLTRKVRLEGITPIMFDRYAGDNTTQLAPEQKMYLDQEGRVCLPAANISSFLSARNTDSVAKVILGGKTYKKLAIALLGFVQISPMMIPFLRDGKPIVFNCFVNDVDEAAKIRIDRRVARLNKGIPNPKERPYLEMPWALEFELSIYKNNVFSETKLQNGFERGGIQLGLGTFRGVFGKFVVAKWE